MNLKPNFEQYKKDQEGINKIPNIKAEFHFVVNDIAKKFLSNEFITEKEMADLEMVYTMTQDLEKEIITHLDMYRSKGIINKTEFLIISNYFLVANQNGPDSNWIKDLFINNNVSPESFKADSEKISIPENTREVLVSVYFKVNNVQSSPESETSEYK